MKNVCILGSTGSIGRAAIEVIQHLGKVRPQDEFKIFAISCYENISLLSKQIEIFKPKYACIINPQSASKIGSMEGTTIITGINGLCEIVSHPDVDIVLNGIVGSAGIYPTLAAIKSKKRIAMANKETIVAYGELIMEEVRRNGVTLIPVDSEHSAIHQCINQFSYRGSNVLKGEEMFHLPLNRIILTASGGPFLNSPITSETTCREALKHPVWEMGKKITIDSATLMNKGLEVIEASFLFKISPKKIEVVIHPQSIIHSAVEFVDGAILAQLSLPDMRLPIQYSLTFPNRYPSLVQSLEFSKLGKLEFASPDLEKFPCLRLAYQSAYEGGTMPAVLNAANEVAVNAFLSERIKLPKIPKIIEKVMGKHKTVKSPSIADIEAAEQWAIREASAEII